MGEFKTADTMVKGQIGVIKGFSEDSISIKLMEMGCLPGEEIVLNYIAPLGDPICISVSGYRLALRKEEASAIYLQ